MLNLDGKVTCKFGPLESSICGLEWGPHGHLYIDLGTKLLTTSCDEGQPLIPLHAEPTTALSVSTKASFLALGVASPTLGFQVSRFYMCWKRSRNIVVHPWPVELLPVMPCHARALDTLEYSNVDSDPCGRAGACVGSVQRGQQRGSVQKQQQYTHEGGSHSE